MCLSQDAIIFIFSTRSLVWPRFYTSLPAGVARHPVRAKDTPSHRPPQGNRTGGDRRKKLEQRQQPIPPLLHSKSFTERQGQGFQINGRREPRPSYAPEGTLDKGVQPPLPPMFHRAPSHTQALAQSVQPWRRDPMLHRRHQHHHKAPVNFAPQEPDRRRGVPFAAAVLIATKTSAINLLVSLPVLLGLAAGLAPILGAVQFARAVEASTLTNLFGHVSIDFLQQLRYLLVCQVTLAPALSLRIFQRLTKQRKPP